MIEKEHKQLVINACKHIAKQEQTEREKELFQEKNLCHSFLIQENLMEQFQSFKERKTGGK